MTDIHDLHRQAQWEMEGTRRAVARYREIEFGVDGKPPADPTTLPSGKALMKGVLKPLIASITDRQVELAETHTRAGRPPIDAWPTLAICPEKAAVITLMSACRRVGGRNAGYDSHACIPIIAKSIAESIRDELHYEGWCQREQSANKAKPPKIDRVKALRLSYPNLDRRTWAKWVKKLDIAALGEWDEKTAITMGANLIHLLVTVAPDRFFITSRKIALGVQYVLSATPSVHEIMQDVAERAQVARPVHMPMLIPPLPWRYAA